MVTSGVGLGLDQRVRRLRGGGHERRARGDDRGEERAGHLADHRVDAAEVWHYYAGAPLVLTQSPNGHDAHAAHLGPDILGGQHPQIVVPAHHWQTATSLGAWTLVGCTVAPAFDFAGFELAPPDWRPTPRG